MSPRAQRPLRKSRACSQGSCDLREETRANRCQCSGAGPRWSGPGRSGRRRGGAYLRRREEHAEPAGFRRDRRHHRRGSPGLENCIVSSVTRASRIDSSGSSTGNNMLVNLNCYSRHSTANSPGYSAASPEGRASQAAEQRLAAQQAAQAQAEQDELAATDAQQGAE
jgi:hypothetical protein